jgi:hypothetical protein
VNTNRPLVVSCGWSDDALGRVRIMQDAGPVGGLAKLPTNPLLSVGAINVGGSATVTNYYNNLTIWSGDTISNIGNSGKTFVRNPLVPPPSPETAPPAPPNSCTTSANYVCLTDKNSIGPDVIDQDPTLGSLSSSQIFRDLTGAQNINDYLEKVKPMIVASNAVGTLANVLGKAIYVNGSITDNMNFTIGSREQPVVLIVNNNWTGGGNTVVHGVVLVLGDIALTGSKTVYGSVIVAGNVSGTGSLDIIYDPFAVKNASDNTGQIGLVPGSWRDWN